MLKKTLAIILTITALLSLSACGLFPPVETEEVVTFDVSEFTKVESEVDTTVDIKDTTETESEVVTIVDTTEITTEAETSGESQDFSKPVQYSGVYNGSEITMTLTLTEYNFPSCMFCPVGFENGYTNLCYHGKRGEENVCYARALFDKNGKMVVEPIYDNIGTVSPDGKVVAYLADNEEDRGKLTGNTKPYLIDLKNNTMTLITVEELTAHRLALENNTSKTINPEYSITGDFSKAYDDYTVFDKDGNECYTFEHAYNAYFVSDETIWCLQDGICALYDAYGKRLSPETQVIGNFEDGLAAFVADGKLGIISDKGEVIISTPIEVQDRFVAAYPPSLWLNEGLIPVNVDGILGIVEISRSNEIDTATVDTTEDVTTITELSEEVSSEDTTVNAIPMMSDEPYVGVEGMSQYGDTGKPIYMYEVIEKIPSTYYEEYPGTRQEPLTATLYHNGEAISIDVKDPRLIALINFQNNLLHYGVCSYSTGYHNSEFYESAVDENHTRLEFTYAHVDITPNNDESLVSPLVLCETVTVTEDFLFAIDADNSYYDKKMYPYTVYSFESLCFRPFIDWLSMFDFLESHGPYVIITEGDDIAFNAIDWDYILSIVPSDHYVYYPDTHLCPDSATLYKEGKQSRLEVTDPRLVRLINFYNNVIHHGIYSYTQGSYNTTDLAETLIDPFHIELTYEPIMDWNSEKIYDKLLALDDTFVGVCSNIPFGSYPSSAFGRDPLHYWNGSWLTKFGF